MLLLRPVLPNCASLSSTTHLGLRTSTRHISTTSFLQQRLPFRPQFQSRVATLSQKRPRASARPITVAALTGATLLAAGAPIYFAPVTRNDAAAFSTSDALPYSHGRDAKVPLSRDGGRSINPAAIRQISLGSILGLGLGVVVSAFSKMLVLVLGLGVVGWQFAARRGYNIIPVGRLQKYVKGIDLRSAINDNAAFKISFGLMFALTAFGEL